MMLKRLLARFLFSVFLSFLFSHGLAHAYGLPPAKAPGFCDAWTEQDFRQALQAGHPKEAAACARRRLGRVEAAGLRESLEAAMLLD